MQNTKNTLFKIWIYGAGAVGCYYGAKLIQAGQKVLFVSRGEHSKILKAKGIQVLSCLGDFSLPLINVCNESELEEFINDHLEFLEPDVILVCTKTYSNKLVAENLKHILKKDVPIFVFQNGVKSQDIFKEVFPSKMISRAVINIVALIKEYGIILHSAGGMVTVPKNGIFAPDLIKLFNSVGVSGCLSENIDLDIWSKTSWNAAFNSVTALTRLTTKPILEDIDGYLLIENICNEVYELAKANGINLPSNLAEQKILYTKNKLGNISTSTLEDVKNNKTVEYEAILGDLIAESRKFKINTPHLVTVFTLLKLLSLSQEKVCN